MKVSSLRKQSGAGAAVYTTTGKVIDFADPLLTIETDEGRLTARRAASCLMECAAGDLVLACIAGDQTAYVLAVLTRDESAPATLSTPGDLNFDLAHGKMRLKASAGVAIASPHEISVTAHQISIGAARGLATVTEGSYVGKQLSAQAETISLFAQVMSSTIGSIYEKLARVFRKVDGIQQVQAGQLDFQARDNLALHGKNTLMTADTLVKVDGAQIHLG